MFEEFETNVLSANFQVPWLTVDSAGTISTRRQPA